MALIASRRLCRFSLLGQNNKTKWLLNEQTNINLGLCQRASGYPLTKDKQNENLQPPKKRKPITRTVKDSVKSFRKEVKDTAVYFGQEVKRLVGEEKERLFGDPQQRAVHGDYEYLFKFDNQRAINSWVLSSDKDVCQGRSESYFHLSKNKTGIFSGTLSGEIVKDGKRKKPSYCSVRSPYRTLAFDRIEAYDFEPFNCLVLRVRGDGRHYLLRLGVDAHFDVYWSDEYHYHLYTRGGPYWQIVKIPLSKFYLSNKGRIQDKQVKLDKTAVSFIGINQSDGNAGTFHLEIDYIALLYDENHKEEFEYELYEANPDHVGT
ncbi:hypothetical protein SNE40_008761 [Patella caerulea]|uniref:NADH:ubiquinone oxidoreductase intermediate-associated protein 30 domain-containing protein n=1 Tax=Patella caerulea TaxID=87958 RepID=A0AAN8JTS1_PATCE